MTSLRIFFQLIRRDLLILKTEYPGKLLDILITFTVWVVVFNFFVPKMGSNSSYGTFIMVGAIASFGIFEVIGQSAALIEDIKGDRTISYLLSLPISSTTVFCYQAFSWAIQSFLYSLPLFFVGKAIFWKDVPLSNIHWVQLSIALVIINICLGFFALWIVSILHRVSNLNRIYFRFVNPLFIFGCYFYTWKVAYQVSPWVAYTTFLDVFSFVMEIMRAAILGPQDYLPFWGSFVGLLVFALIFGLHSVKRLKKILDCV